MHHTFSNNLARLRKERGWTQEKLAKALDLSFQAISKWETAQSYSDIALLPRLAALFETSVDSLLGYVPTKASATKYEQRYQCDGYYWGVAPNRMCYEVMRLMPPTKPLRLLDMCCGEGKDAVFFANNGYIVSAFDIAQSGLDKGRKLAECNGCVVSFFTADIREFIPNDTFDIIYTSGGLLYFAPDKREEMMSIYKQKTTPGGLHAVNTFVEKPFIARAPDSEDNEHYWKSGELFSHYQNWRFHVALAEQIFDCNSNGHGGSHQHCMDTLIAQAPHE
ncbi:MAG: methyltransferase domain-containing protein [Oscillospiraceae bacterium]|nr:methyltransferase domain-containing protein [Oscillospiraceae bacterium]